MKGYPGIPKSVVLSFFSRRTSDPLLLTSQPLLGPDPLPNSAKHSVRRANPCLSECFEAGWAAWDLVSPRCVTGPEGGCRSHCGTTGAGLMERTSRTRRGIWSRCSWAFCSSRDVQTDRLSAFGVAWRVHMFPLSERRTTDQSTQPGPVGPPLLKNTIHLESHARSK